MHLEVYIFKATFSAKIARFCSVREKNAPDRAPESAPTQTPEALYLSGIAQSHYGTTGVLMMSIRATEQQKKASEQPSQSL